MFTGVKRRGYKSQTTSYRPRKRARPYETQAMCIEPTMQFVRRTMGPRAATERKYFDSFLNDQALVANNTWAGSELDPAAVLCLFAPSEGSDLDNRIGRKVTVKSIKIRGALQCITQSAQSAADYANCVRLILFIDQQTNAVQCQAEELMQDPGAANALLCGQTFQNTANFGRFKVLRDKTYVLDKPPITAATDAGNTIVQAGLIRPFKLSYKFTKPFNVRFNGTNGGTVADIIDNSFHLAGRVNNTGMACTISYQVRVTYTDQ